MIHLFFSLMRTARTLFDILKQTFVNLQINKLGQYNKLGFSVLKFSNL